MNTPPPPVASHRRQRPTPSLFSPPRLRRADPRMLTPAAIDDEPVLGAELRWTGQCMVAGFLVGTVIAAAVFGPAAVVRALWAAVTGQPL